MQRLFFLRTFLTPIIFFLIALPLSPLAFAAHLPSIGFYYGDGITPAAFQDFSWMVVNPGKQRLPKDFSSLQKVFAYVSIGETTPGDSSYADLPDDCVLGQDTAWGGKIINLAHAECRSYLLQKIINPVWRQGYRGLFLDTLDTYELVSGVGARQKQEQGLVQLIKAIKAAHPNTLLLANRGFAVLPQIHQLLTGVLAESLLHAWDQSTQTYHSVPQDQQRELINQLRTAQGYNLPIFVIDYLPPKLNRAGWWRDAQKISSLGFIPYVTDAQLTAIGAGLREPMPRHVLILSDSNNPERSSTAFTNGVTPLEYLGYIPVFRSISQGLPSKPIPGQYAGVIVWSDGDPIDDRSGLSRWLKEAKAQGIPLLLLGDFPDNLNSNIYHDLRMLKPESVVASSAEINSAHKWMNYEIKVRADARDFLKTKAPRGSAVWLQLQDASENTEDAVAITPWGGYALAPYLLTTLPNQNTRWLVNPFALYRKAFRLPKMPVPDTTTESGRRLFMAQIDGDGFVSRAEFPPYHIAGEVYTNRILVKYKLPVTGSVIVGDLLPGSRGLYPNLAPLETAVAQKVFRLPYVEIGSHTWSHPFNWPAIEAGRDFPGINLPVPGYKFSPYKEAVGAAEWIDRHLAPTGKRVVIDQWSGDTRPDSQVLRLAYGAGLANINGLGAYISKKDPSITAVSPIGIFRGNSLQVFAPDANDDYYTNQWRGPFWGYLNVIQTFEMTDKPHRLDPIDIYTHWYTATKLASLAALGKVYNWALRQSITPVYAANYADIADNFFTVHVARQGEGFWIGNATALRELRMPRSLGFPDVQSSHGVAGYNKTPNGHFYVHMDGNASVYLALQPTAVNFPYIASANAPISSFVASPTGFDAQLRGDVPVNLQLVHTQSCKVELNDRVARLSPSSTLQSSAHNVLVHVRCP